jgi:hypothetical protein
MDHFIAFLNEQFYQHFFEQMKVTFKKDTLFLKRNDIYNETNKS